jgi:hypothetical protein
MKPGPSLNHTQFSQLLSNLIYMNISHILALCVIIIHLINIVTY